ncbi:hypothetical protein WJX84_000196 [Apatococcus fuscideae]|uniref:Uncharacterized protein n=1 Tax=Apatococcus fuscideae TaxID=2026836 RepID=A0AAW1T3L5_9CHLO
MIGSRDCPYVLKEAIFFAVSPTRTGQRGDAATSSRQRVPAIAAHSPQAWLLLLKGSLSMEVEMAHSTSAFATHADKDTTPLDEQLARELHAQLNDPQNAPPLTRRRTRKAPSFYTPQAGGQQAADTSGAESGDLASPHRPAKRAREEASPPALKPIFVKHRSTSGHQQDDGPALDAPGNDISQPPHNAIGSGMVPASHQEAAEADGVRPSALSPSAKRSKAQPAGMEPSPFEKGQPDHKPATSPGADVMDSPRSSGLKTKASAKLPKLPMVLKGSKWYRGRLLRDSGPRVLVEASGLEDPPAQEWLPKESERLWRGSYKGKDWRYLGDGAWEPRTRSCRRNSLKASGSSNSTDDQVRLGTVSGLNASGQPCLRCKTSSGNTAEQSQDSKGSSSDRSSLAEDLFEAQGNGTPASHPRGKCPGPFDEDLHPEDEDKKEQRGHSAADLDEHLCEGPKTIQDLPAKQQDTSCQSTRAADVKPEPAAPSQTSGGNNCESREQDPRNTEDELQKEFGDAGHGAANGLQCEEALPEDDIPAGKASDSQEESMREGQSHAAGCSAPEAEADRAAASHRTGDGGSSGEARPRAEPRRRNIRKKGMKRPRVPLPEEAEEEASGEDADKAGAAPEQQAIRASSRIRTPAMKAEGSDFILTHELGRKAPRLTDSGDGGSGGAVRKGSSRRGGRRANRKGVNGVGQTGSLDHLSDGQEYAHQPADSVLAPNGIGKKARRSGVAKGSNLPSGLMHKQRGAMLQREGSGISAALVCGNSLGTLIQALHAHENKMAPVHQPREALSQPTAAWMASFAAPTSPPFPLFV